MAKRHGHNEAKVAIIYCRVSTRSQQEEGTSLETQAEACIKHAKSLGYQVGRVTKETYSGAELWDRPLLARDRAAIMAGEFQALIVYALDRLSREQNAQGLIACECVRGDCELISVTENLDHSPQGKFLRGAAAFAAELEREKIRERTMRGRHAALQSGKPAFGGSTLFGYVPNREEGRYEIIETEAVLVRRIFEMCASGIGCHAIASTMNREGIPSPKVGEHPGAKWCAATLYRMLKNESYKGEEYQGRTKLGTKKNGHKLKSTVYLPREKWIKLPEGTRPAIVSVELWETVQERLKANAGAATRNKANPVLLRGLIFCGECGGRMIRNHFHRGKYDYDKYRCGSHWRPFKTACTGKGVPVKECNEWVWAHVKSVFNDPTKIEQELRRLEETRQDPQLEIRLQNQRRELARVESEIQALVHRFRKSVSNEALLPAVEREIKSATKEKEQLETAISRLEAQIDAHNRAAVDMKSLRDYCQQTAKRLNRLTFNERRTALEALDATVSANGSDRENWELTVRIPTQPDLDVSPLHVRRSEEHNYILLTFGPKSKEKAA